ncbi:PAS-domain containing protein [Maritimibacter sp. 55A14]|uniref:PAS-domain containing protein n=1 Tax=Maritimibacter sp. 55A14 TaxID=2174844 RepID=UPI001304B318|nr:PAS-domain containing protein [Maritimibacter sp. 55A14]
MERALSAIMGRKHYLYYGVIAGLVLVAAVMTEEWRRAELRDEEREVVREQIEAVRAALQAQITDKELMTRGLTAVLEVQPEISAAEFAHIARNLRQNNPTIINMAFLSDYVVRYVYPQEPNAGLIGTDLRQIPEQFAAARQAVDLGRPVIDGPVELIQGGSGFIIRAPVARPGPRGQPAGMVSVVFDADELYEMVGLLKQDLPCDLAIRKVGADGSTEAAFFGDDAVFASTPQVVELALPARVWQIAAVPIGGWNANMGSFLPLRLGFLVLGAGALLVFANLRKQYLGRARAQSRLTTAVESLADGFVLFDAEDRLILSNSKYRDLHSKCADAIVPGARFEDFLRVGLQRGQFPDAEGREEEWLAEQLRPPGEEPTHYEIALSDGRWMRILEKRTPEGGRVGLRIDVTDQVESRLRAEAAEAEARLARAQLVAAVETLPDGFALYDAEDRLALCNSKYKEIYDRSAEAITPGARFEDILRFGISVGQYPDAIGREEEWEAERLAEHRAAASTFEEHLADGRWLRIIERPTPDGGRVGLRVDLTEQVESRRRAERAEQRLRDAINALPAGFWLFDGDGRLVMFNDFFCELYEVSAPAVRIGATSEEILRYGLDLGEYPEAVGREEEWLSEVQGRFASGDCEWEYPLSNGRWIRSYNRSTSEGGLVGIRVDVTALKRQQTELEETNADLRMALTARDAAQKRFFDIAEISTDWIWEQDRHLRFTYVSESFEKCTGRAGTSILGHTREEVFADVPDVWESADWDWLRAMLAAYEPFENFVYRAGGTAEEGRWVRISGAPVFDEKGEFNGYRGVGGDVSVLYNAMHAAEAANKAKTEFLNVMSHELRTPLTVILGYNAFLSKPDLLPSVQALKKGIAAGAADTAEDLAATVTDEIARYAEKMNLSGQHLLTLINDMLDLAKIDAGKMELQRETVALDDMVATVLEQLGQSAAEKGLALEQQTHGEEVKADATRLRQILINLIGNAIKFTESGRITVQTANSGGKVSVTVEDTGRGISEDQKESIFEQFQQVDSSGSRAAGGTGLGLTITRFLVELHGGRISVDSTPGKGSRFTFTLPAASG